MPKDTLALALPIDIKNITDGFNGDENVVVLVSHGSDVDAAKLPQNCAMISLSDLDDV